MSVCRIDVRAACVHARGYCGAHYQRAKTAGEFTPLPHSGDSELPSPRRIAQFWARVDKAGEHWIWTGTSHLGYGTTSLNGRHIKAHRLAYMIVTGRPIPDGLQVDHVCRVKLCVRPDHLEAVTHQENQRRRAAAQTHCRNGHPKAPSGKSSFDCLTCWNEWHHRRATCPYCGESRSAKGMRVHFRRRHPEFTPLTAEDQA